MQLANPGGLHIFSVFASEHNSTCIHKYPLAHPCESFLIVLLLGHNR